MVLACFLAAALAATSPALDTRMVDAAQAFLTALGPEQKAGVLLPFDDENRFDWHYIPRRRQGMALAQMSEGQRRAAMDLLRASLSDPGFAKAETVRNLEHVLRALENSDHRDAERYYFTVFGEPAGHGVWGWRYEGHHLSLNFTVIDGKVVSTTPQFFGAHPAEVKDGPQKGTRALPEEEDRARALVESLTPEQRRRAVLSDTAPRDILTAAARDASRQEDVGIPWSALDKAQQERLRSLIEAHAAAQTAARVAERMARADQEQADVRFVWLGGLKKGEGHYYRIQGRTFLIEYDNTQDSANHIHTVWRDFKGDWGADVLAEHYHRAHSH
jgi:hypothetical protein